MKTIVFAVDTTAKKEIDLEDVAGGKIKTVHSTNMYKQDDMTAIWSATVTMAAAPKATATKK